MEPERQTWHLIPLYLYYHIQVLLDLLKIEASSFCNCLRICELLTDEGKTALYYSSMVHEVHRALGAIIFLF